MKEFTREVRSGSSFGSRIQRVSHQLIPVFPATLTSIFGPSVERGEADDRHVRDDFYGAPSFSAPRQRPRSMRRDLEEWRTGRDAMPCDAAGPYLNTRSLECGRNCLSVLPRHSSFFS